MKNIRDRRGSKVCITIPMFQDERTKESFGDVLHNKSGSDTTPTDVDAHLRFDSPQVDRFAR